MDLVIGVSYDADIKQTKEETRHVWGEEKGDSAGVRKNYLEKEFYGSVKTDFDYKKYISEIEKKSINADNLNDLYNIKNYSISSQ